LGHNEHIAWGFTIFGIDQQDLYVEELNPANPLEYKTEAGWKKMEVRREVFLIKNATPTEVDLKFTRHGPVLWQDGKRALALRWVGTEPGTAGYLASLAITAPRIGTSSNRRWRVGRFLPRILFMPIARATSASTPPDWRPYGTGVVCCPCPEPAITTGQVSSPPWSCHTFSIRVKAS